MIPLSSLIGNFQAANADATTAQMIMTQPLDN